MQYSLINLTKHMEHHCFNECVSYHLTSLKLYTFILYSQRNNIMFHVLCGHERKYKQFYADDTQTQYHQFVVNIVKYIKYNAFHCDFNKM